ncbi:(2Fe-2S)-binding protein [Asticcacaulis sp. W401b]|uniref:(2Fe-2S)-binding protein n=1 Tax=Asticcacaulis sp. W401b TaxID=3388666 RepID=UPI003970D30B
MKFTINGKAYEQDVPEDMPLLWALRDEFGLVGTKFGCGIAQCGACTVHVDGTPVRACITPVSAVEGAVVTTIEGIGETKEGKALQAAWLEVDVMQCGYCQAGQIMTVAALLKETPKPSDAEIDAAMDGNLCRCATYTRIRSAIKKAAGMALADTREA